MTAPRGHFDAPDLMGALRRSIERARASQRCPMAGGSEAGYCRCALESGHDGEHRCQHGRAEKGHYERGDDSCGECSHARSMHPDGHCNECGDCCEFEEIR